MLLILHQSSPLEIRYEKKSLKFLIKLIKINNIINKKIFLLIKYIFIILIFFIVYIYIYIFIYLFIYFYLLAL